MNSPAIIAAPEPVAATAFWLALPRHHHCRPRLSSPSDVPENPVSYSQNRAADDILAVLDHLCIEKARVCGPPRWGDARRCISKLSPVRPGRCRCAWPDAVMAPNRLTREKCSGPKPTRRGGVAALRWHGGVCGALVPTAQPACSSKPSDPRGFAVFKEALAEHSALGAANTPARLPGRSVYVTLRSAERSGRPQGADADPHRRRGLALFNAGAADEAHTSRLAALAVMPNCGHTINLEAPALFNGIVGEFLAQVDAGRWPMRDPRAMSGSITGIR